MKRSIIKFLLILFLIVNVKCIDEDKSKVKKVKGGTITKQEYDTRSTPASFQDEKLEVLKKHPHYKDFFYDYGNYWVNTSNKNDCLLFELNSGKLIQFEDYITLNSPSNSNKVFIFNVKNSKPIKIVGEFGFRDGDTIMHWTFDEKRKVLINDEGLIFKQIKIK
jgi:hypothetical protein